MIQEMKNNALTKAKSRKGFTLAELLIVVAIIAILVAIAVPLFANQLNSAKKATDDANYRIGKALAMGHQVELMEGTTPTAASGNFFNEKTGQFDLTAKTDAYKAKTDGTDPTRKAGQVLQITHDTATKVSSLNWVAGT